MLKIVTLTDVARTVFELQGRLAGAWVQELEDSWRKGANSHQTVRVMICAVSFIDEKGKALLVEMHQHELSLWPKAA